MSGRHEGPPLGSAAREATAMPYVGRRRRRGDLRDRLFDRLIIQPDGCVVWSGTKAEGYGYVKIDGIGRKVHRLMWQMFAGSIPEGMTIDHLCRNRACANVAHLELVSVRENVLRGVGPSALNATKTHCPKGHPYDEVNTYRPHSRVERLCHQCRRDRDQMRSQPDPYPDRCPSCGHPYDAECGCLCCYDDHSGGPDDV